MSREKVRKRLRDDQGREFTSRVGGERVQWDEMNWCFLCHARVPKGKAMYSIPLGPTDENGGATRGPTFLLCGDCRTRDGRTGADCWALCEQRYRQIQAGEES